MKKRNKLPTSEKQAIDNLIKKYNAKLYKKSAQRKVSQLVYQKNLQNKPISTSLSQAQFQQQQALNRQRRMGIMSGRAEALELEMVSLNEIPLLHQMERERTRLTTPPDNFLIRTEKEVTDSFPD